MSRPADRLQEVQSPIAEPERTGLVVPLSDRDDATTDTERAGGAEQAQPLPILADELSAISLRQRPRRSFMTAVAVATLFAALYLPNAGAFGLWDPWETHYGEVTRNMIESVDWVAPWWGYKEKIGTEAREGSAFFSKPVFIFWSEAVFVRLVGFGEWAMRLPVALLGLLAALVVFLTFSRLYDRRIGFLAALIMGTSPQFYFLARQSQTDMPFVSTMTMAICFFALAVFARREEVSNRRFLLRLASVVTFLLMATVPQYGVLVTDLKAPSDYAEIPGLRRAWLVFQNNGVYHAVVYSVLLAIVLVTVAVPLIREWRATGTLSDETKDRWTRRFYLWTFYALAAFATLAKGLLGFMLPGAIIFFFMLLSGRWRALKRVELVRGLLIFVAVGFPWYVAMFAKFGMPYYTRFFIHDHFNRIGAGVHQIDTGTFEHFIKWLGFGMYPWVAFVPFVFAGFSRFLIKDKSPENLLKLFVFLWFFTAFMLFTLSSTKFHHYIFPALPPLAILLGLYLTDFMKERSVAARLVVIIAIGLFAAVSWDLRGDTQHLRNLFTYKYDRPLPDYLPIDADAPVAKGASVTWADSVFYEHTNPLILNLLNTKVLRYETFILIIGGVGVLCLLLFLFRRSRRIGLWGMGGVAIVMVLYVLNYYMPMLSPHWSQKYLFEAYYDDCHLVEQREPIQEAYTPILTKAGLGAIPEYLGAEPKRVCEEDIISWLITWRGETYYSNNEIKPVNKEASQFEPYLRDYNRGRTFYVLMERGKDAAWASKLNGTYLKKLKANPDFREIRRFDVKKIHDENDYFILLKATPIRTDEAEAPARTSTVDEPRSSDGSVVPD